MRCFSDVLKKTLPPDVFGDVLEKVKHRTNDASNDVSRPALCEEERVVNKTFEYFWGQFFVEGL